MKKTFDIGEIEIYYPNHEITETEHHFFIENYFQFGGFILSARIPKTLPLFKNGQPLLPTRPIYLGETKFSTLIGTTADCLYAEAWFGDFHDASKNVPKAYFAFEDLAKSKNFLASAYWDQSWNWFRKGVDGNILPARRAPKFIKDADLHNGHGV